MKQLETTKDLSEGESYWIKTEDDSEMSWWNYEGTSYGYLRFIHSWKDGAAMQIRIDATHRFTFHTEVE